MQSFFGLLPSGELNAETLAVLKKPHCGLSDVEQFGKTFRWKNHIFSYRMTEERLPFPAAQIHKVFRVASKIWSKVAHIKFCNKKSGNADIDISFVSGGINPRYISQLSKRPPPRTPNKCDPDLSFDAVTGLQQELVFFKDRFMWRKHKHFVETGISLISSFWPHPIPSYLDAVYENVEMNVILFFKGLWYWKLKQLALQEGFPRNISDVGFPSRIKSVDAALHFKEEHYTVFFTGHECWSYLGSHGLHPSPHWYNEKRSMMDESLMLIEQQWPEIPVPIDATVFHEGFVKFFKGN